MRSFVQEQFSALLLPDTPLSDMSFPELFVAVAVVVVVGLLIASTTASAAFRGGNGKIAFTTDRDGNNEIYTMNANGTNPTRLTNYSGSDDQAAWSPNGQKIAFTRYAAGFPGGSEVYTMNADGTNLTIVSHGYLTGTDNTQPTWSPDGTKIAFASDQDTNNNEIYTINADGTSPFRVTNNPANDSEPSWSPDGTKIAFQTDRSGHFEVWTVKPDGTGETQPIDPFCVDVFTDGMIRAHVWSPDWSPDGTKIAYARTDFRYDVDTGDSCDIGPDPDVLAQANTDGSGEQLLKGNDHGNDHTARFYDPAFSPSGGMIAYEAGDGDIHLFTIYSGSDFNLTNNGAADSRPAWQPTQPPYETPGQAPKLDIYLTPVFKPCGTGGNPVNTTHGAPDFPGGPNPDQSCNPPGPTGTARVGRLSVGTVHLEELPSADITIQSDITDVTNSSGADYNPAAGADLTLTERIRLTDTYNGASLNSPGTVTEFDFGTPIGCAVTATALVGSHCSVNTTANAVIPGMVKSGKSAVLNIFRIRVTDSGPDNIRGNTDDKIFLQQGLFTP